MYLRIKENKEVDFVLVDSDHLPQKMIEVKYSDTSVSKNLIYFKNKYGISAVQLVRTISKVGFLVDDISILRAEEFLTEIDG